MTKHRLRAGASLFALAAVGASLALALSTPALAQDAGATPPAAAPQTPSDSLAVNVVRRMVAKGLITQADADDLIAGAQADTAKAKAAELAEGGVQTTAGGGDGILRVPYIPENVRAQIKDELRTEVVAQAKEERWALPNTFPDWTSRIKIFGDFRFRDESHYFSKRNFYGFVDGSAFNGAGPIDVNSAPFPILNSTKNSNILQLRARLGFTATITDQLTTTFMIASGNNNGPISTIQDLGSDFGKKNLWLDQAYATWKPQGMFEGATVQVGRFPNPYISTENLFKQDDFQLDGVMAAYGQNLPHVDGLTGHVTVGAYPIEFGDTGSDDTPVNAPSTAKLADKSKWLFAGQVGLDYAFTPKLSASVNIGYYDFENVQGQPSSCQYTDLYCFGDPTRPGYLQKGNTLIYLRPNITNPTTGASPQFLGLAANFRDLDLLARVDYAVRDGLHIVATGDYVKNLGFDEGAILAHAGGVDGLATNNETCAITPGEALPPGTACNATDPVSGKPYGHNVFKSGDSAWLARLSVGAPSLTERGNWKLSLAYLYIEPDAVMDAFDDKDFRLGGTNSKGFVLEADYAIAHNTYFAVKWLSADAIYGPPFSVDNLQVDFNTKF